MTKHEALAEKTALEKHITELDATEARRKPTDPAIDIPLVRSALTDHDADEREAFERIAALVAFYENSLRPLVERVEKAEAHAEKYRAALVYVRDLLRKLNAPRWWFIRSAVKSIDAALSEEEAHAAYMNERRKIEEAGK